MCESCRAQDVAMVPPKKFVSFVEDNEWEGEDWRFWLQVDGNEEELAKFRDLIASNEQALEVFTLAALDDPDGTLDEYCVDLLVKHSMGGYMAWDNKVSGKFTCPASEGFEESDVLYKGGIRRCFK